MTGLENGDLQGKDERGYFFIPKTKPLAKFYENFCTTCNIQFDCVSNARKHDDIVHIDKPVGYCMLVQLLETAK